MKLSLNWLKRYLHIAYSPEKIAEFLTLTGLEVEGIEKVESIAGGLKGVVVGQVLTCERHPDADRLSVTTVDIGEGDPLSIVCGAPNVAKDQKVLVATIGTVLFDQEGKPFTIKKGKIRGQDSYGMICAADELGLGNDHSGIIVLDPNTAIGTAASAHFNLEDDYLLEIGLTPNRSDATSQLGVARDLLAYLKVHENYHEDIIEPDVSTFVTRKTPINIGAEVSIPKQCIRYTGVTISNIKVKESPEWMQKLLKSIGVKAINNVVDVTNFILHELGQPLHAFDADKIGGGKIIVRNLPAGTIFKTLDDIDRKLYAEDIMITDAEENGLCLGGVYGGKHSGVNATTTNIFLEAACFHSSSIRRTSTRHNLRTDAAKVFEKGSDPNITEFAIKRAASLIVATCGGEISSQMVDIYPKPVLPAEIILKYQDVYDIIGVHIKPETIRDILLSMDMEIEPFENESILVKVPTNKVDVTRDVDLIEEILRIFGLNNVPIPLKISSTISYSPKPNKYRIKEIISNYLAAKGFNEIMGLSLIESQKHEASRYDANKFVYINNTSNIHLNIMRPDMLISGLQTIAFNINRQQHNLSLFEFGKAYQTNENGFDENEKLTILLTGKKNEESWLTDAKATMSFYDIKEVVVSILERLGLSKYKFSEIQNDTRWSYGLSVNQGPTHVVSFGEVDPVILKGQNIKAKVFYAEFSVPALVGIGHKSKTSVSEISKFPTMRRDLALIIGKEVSFEQIQSIAYSVDQKILKQIQLFDVFTDESKIGEGKKSYAVSFGFEHLSRTLQDKEVDDIMQRIIMILEEKTGAKIRK
jgi:phenylalanyl-tRNA synthetase beta chain